MWVNVSGGSAGVVCVGECQWRYVCAGVVCVGVNISGGTYVQV